MKNICLLLSCLFCIQFADAQVFFGVKGGVSTTNIDPNEIKITDDGGTERLGIALKQANFGVHAGIVLQAYFNKFLLQPEINFNSNKVDYELQDFSSTDLLTEVRSEKYQYLDIPILVGIQAGPVRFQAGPEAHVFIASISDIEDEGYDPAFDAATFGWIGGLGFDIWKSLTLDIRYEGNFSKFGSHFKFNGQEYEFDQSPARILFSLGFIFGKKKE